MDNKRWNECKQTCEDCSFSILNIEDNDELVGTIYSNMLLYSWTPLTLDSEA